MNLFVKLFLNIYNKHDQLPPYKRVELGCG
jgi:hypothetical protein